jgi:hypothetical protein
MATPAPAHAVPAGPLAVRWLAYELPPLRAGAISVGRLELENAGSAAWRSRPGTDIHLSYHWLDVLGNPIIWAGHYILLPERVAPGQRVDIYVTVRSPVPPGRYRLAFDLVNEGRYWFTEVGNERLELDVEVLPRLAERTLGVVVAPGPDALADATQRALEQQEEPVTVSAGAAATAYLAAGCRPAPDWASRLLDAHAEGFAAVAGSITVDGGPLARARGRELAAWRPGFGRSPAWPRPLLCPSLVEGLEAEPAPGPGGLPSLEPGALDEPTLCDGRIRVAVDATALRRGGRRPV